MYGSFLQARRRSYANIYKPLVDAHRTPSAITSLQRINKRTHSTHGGVGLAPSNKMHMFWTNRCSNGCWPRASSFDAGQWCLQLGLATALRCGYEVHLWTYSECIRGLPDSPNLHLRDANEIVCRSKAERAITKMKWREAHVADWVRCKAAQKYVGGSNDPSVQAGAHVCDVDVIHFTLMRHLPNSSGDAYNSMPAKWSVPQWLGGGDPMNYWATSFLHEPYEPSWFSSPWYFASGSRVLNRVVEAIEARFAEERPRKPAYTFIMDIVKEAVIQEGFISSIMEPVAYNMISPNNQMCLVSAEWWHSEVL